MSEEEIKALKEQIETIEKLLNTIIENQNEIKELLNKQIQKMENLEKTIGGGVKERREREGTKEGEEEKKGKMSLLEVVELRKYLDIDEVRAKAALNRLIEQGVVVRLEGANRTIVASKKAIQDLLSKMPLSVKDAAKMDNREYELLKILNELGYVIRRENGYIATDLAKELLQ